jgi:hypothetical protein
MGGIGMQSSCAKCLHFGKLCIDVKPQYAFDIHGINNDVKWFETLKAWIEILV